MRPESIRSVIAEAGRCRGTTPVVTEDDVATRLVPVDIEVVPHPVVRLQDVRGGLRPRHLAGDDCHPGRGEGAVPLRGRVVAPDRVVHDADVVRSRHHDPVSSDPWLLLARRTEAGVADDLVVHESPRPGRVVRELLTRLWIRLGAIRSSVEDEYSRAV